MFDIYSNMTTLFALNLPGSGHVDLPLVITHQPVAPRNTPSFIGHQERACVRRICGIFSVRSTALIYTAEEDLTARARGQRLNIRPGHRTTLCDYCFCSYWMDASWPVRPASYGLTSATERMSWGELWTGLCSTTTC